MSPCSDFYDRAIPVLNRVEVWNSEMLLLLFCFLLITAPAFCCLHPNFFEHVAELNSEWANVFLKMLRIKYRFVRLANHWILFSFTFHSVTSVFGFFFFLDRIGVEELETCLHWQTCTSTVCTSSADHCSVYVLCSGSAHAQPNTAHFAQLSFTYLPVTIETQWRRMQKAGWQTDMQETWVES